MLPKGVPGGFMTLVFPCFAVYATIVIVALAQGEVPREVPCAREIPHQKMTLENDTWTQNLSITIGQAFRS